MALGLSFVDQATLNGTRMRLRRGHLRDRFDNRPERIYTGDRHDLALCLQLVVDILAELGFCVGNRRRKRRFCRSIRLMSNASGAMAALVIQNSHGPHIPSPCALLLET